MIKPREIPVLRLFTSATSAEVGYSIDPNGELPQSLIEELSTFAELCI